MFAMRAADYARRQSQHIMGRWQSAPATHRAYYDPTFALLCLFACFLVCIVLQSSVLQVTRPGTSQRRD